MRVLLIHGPNLNMLGVREPAIYGSDTLEAINGWLQATAAELAVDLEILQSNHEGVIVDAIQARHGAGLKGAIINPGAFTHYSIAILDAIKAVDYPFVEVHLSNLARREPFRQHSVISAAAVGTIHGLGWHGYELALRAIAGMA